VGEVRPLAISGPPLACTPGQACGLSTRPPWHMAQPGATRSGLPEACRVWYSRYVPEVPLRCGARRTNFVAPTSPRPRYSKEELARRGDEIYEREVLPRLTSEDEGKYALIDIESGY